jgi:hypothetical protein
MLDNHTVKLETQGFILFSRITRRGEGEITLHSILMDMELGFRGRRTLIVL